MILELDGYRDYAEAYTVFPKLQTLQTPLSILPGMADINVCQHGIDKEHRVELLRRTLDAGCGARIYEPNIRRSTLVGKYSESL